MTVDQEEQVKSREEIMEILEAFDLTQPGTSGASRFYLAGEWRTSSRNELLDALPPIAHPYVENRSWRNEFIGFARIAERTVTPRQRHAGSAAPQKSSACSHDAAADL